MAVTYSEHGAVINASAQGDVLPSHYYKAIFWNLDGATINTHKLQLTEGAAAGGENIYKDAAPKTDGAVPIPCPEGEVDGIYIADLDNGSITAYPRKNA